MRVLRVVPVIEAEAPVAELTHEEVVRTLQRRIAALRAAIAERDRLLRISRQLVELWESEYGKTHGAPVGLTRLVEQIEKVLEERVSRGRGKEGC